MTFWKNVDEKTAILDDMGRKYSYSDLDIAVTELSRNLQGYQLALVEMDNSVESLIFYLSCLYMEIPVIIVNKGIGNYELLQYIQKYNIDLIYILNDSATGLLLEIDYDIKCSISNYSLYMRKKIIKKDINFQLALLLPTSGTCKISKLVRISRENLIDNAKNIIKTLDIVEGDIAITSLPLSYSFGLSVLHTHLMKHATILLTSKSVAQKSFWEFANQNSATSFAGVPYTYEILFKSGHMMRINTIKKYIQAGGRLRNEVRDAFITYCTDNKKTFSIMYGQTEATARMTILPWNRITDKKESVGTAIEGGKLYIDNSSTKDGIGEIIYEGKNVCLGYCNSIDDLSIGDKNGGILHTGDYGYMDEEGFLYLKGRREDFVKIYGKRICLQSISEFLDEQFNIESVVTYEKNAFLVKYKSDTDNKTGMILEALCSSMNFPKNMFIVKKIDEFDRTINGKIRRSRCEN